MNKTSSNKALIITLVIIGLVLIGLNIAQRSNEQARITDELKNTNQMPTDVIQPQPDIREVNYTAIAPATGGQKVVMLSLTRPDAKLTTRFTNGEPEVVESGTYTEAGDFVTVLLVDKNGERAQVPQDLTFDKQDDGTLVLLNPEQEGYGAEGLVLAKNENDLSNSSWYWKETLMNDGTRTAPNDPKQFKLTFEDALNMNTTTDCNNGAGTYYTSGGKIAFGPMAVTKMFCEGSQEDVYFQALNQIESYMLDVSKLVLMYPYDSGSMVFEKAAE